MNKGITIYEVMDITGGCLSDAETGEEQSLDNGFYVAEITFEQAEKKLDPQIWAGRLLVKEGENPELILEKLQNYFKKAQTKETKPVKKINLKVVK